MKNFLILITILFCVFHVTGQTTSFQSKFSSEKLAEAPVKLIPFPQHVNWNKGYLKLKSVHLVNEEFLIKPIKNELISILHEAHIEYTNIPTSIPLQITKNPNLPSEGYTLKVISNSITVGFGDDAGLFYAFQTLKQLIKNINGIPYIQYCTIEDYPIFPLRGFMIDVGRNFQSISILKQQLDIMARYKMNTFHWHLTDNPAWRIESKKYPELTAAKNHIETRDPGMYYTYEEIRDLIHYAKQKQIQVIPEIDMPGHSESFVTSTGFKMESKEGLKILKEILVEFFTEIPKELCPTIHIGSDEVKIPNPEGFMKEIISLCRANEREIIIWNPGLPADNQVIRQTWEDKPQKKQGYREIDSWNSYINNGEPYIHISNLFFKPIGSESKNTVLGGILCLWPDVNLESSTDAFQQNPVYPSLLTYAWKTWTADITSASRNYITQVPTIGTDENKYFSIFETYLLHHKDRYFNNLPFQYSKQAETSWSLYGPFKTTLTDSLDNNLNNFKKMPFKTVSGNSVYIRDRFQQGGVIY